MRIYDQNGNAKQDIDWSHNFRMDGKSYQKGTVHMHYWQNGKRSSEHRLPTPWQERQFRPYLDKLNQGDEIIWQ